MDNHQDHIDSLLQRYLLLLDEYTSLRAQLSALQSSVFRDIARANFSAERGLRYGRDQYDERMQALRTVRIAPQGEEDRNGEGLHVFEVEMGREIQEAEKDEGDQGSFLEEESAAELEVEDEDEGEQREKKKSIGKDPLRWFGLLTPQTLRAAQASSIEVVEKVVPRLVTVEREMAQVEIEVRRARKKRAKAEAAVAPASGKGAVASHTGIKAA